MEDARTALRLYRCYQGLKEKGDDFFNESLQVEQENFWSTIMVTKNFVSASRSCTVLDVACNGWFQVWMKSRQKFDIVLRIFLTFSESK